MSVAVPTSRGRPTPLDRRGVRRSGARLDHLPDPPPSSGLTVWRNRSGRSAGRSTSPGGPGRRRRRAAARGRGGPRRHLRPQRADEEQRMAAHAVVRGRDDVAALRSPARDRGRRLRATGQAVGQDDDRSLGAGMQVARPQRSHAPGPRSQSGQRRPERAGTEWVERVRALDHDDLVHRRLGQPGEDVVDHSCCFEREPRRRSGGEDDRGDHDDAAVMVHDHDPGRRAVGSAGSPTSDPSTTCTADDVADDGVVGRERRRGPRHHEDCERAAPGGSVAVFPIARPPYVVGGRAEGLSTVV